MVDQLDLADDDRKMSTTSEECCGSLPLESGKKIAENGDELSLFELFFLSIESSSAPPSITVDTTGSHVIIDMGVDVCGDEVNGILDLIIDSAYNVHQTGEPSDDQTVELESAVDDSQSQSVDEELAEVTSVTGGPLVSSDSFIVESIEICQQEVDEGAVVAVEEKTTDPAGSSSSSDTFYDNAELQRRGYVKKIVDGVRCVVNSTVPFDALLAPKMECYGVPTDMKSNELVPLLEKCGRFAEFRLTENGVLTVTYKTELVCKNAVKTLDECLIKGKKIKVVKVEERNRLYVQNLPVKATKADLLTYFHRLTKGLVELYLLYEPASPTDNRGYCFLTYSGHECARAALEVISKSTCVGRKLSCDWLHSRQKALPSSYMNEPVLLFTRIMVGNIAKRVMPSDLLRFFQRTTQGITDFYIGSKDASCFINPGYCFVTYKDRESAAAAHDILTNLRYAGRMLTCEFSNRVSIKSRSELPLLTPRHKVYLLNFRSSFSLANLRSVFSTFGTVTEIDRNGNWAAITFSRADDAEEAVRHVDRAQLGEWVIVTQEVLPEPIGQRSRSPKSNVNSVQPATNRSGDRRDGHFGGEGRTFHPQNAIAQRTDSRERAALGM